jgi:hypothetical protein
MLIPDREQAVLYAKGGPFGLRRARCAGGPQWFEEPTVPNVVDQLPLAGFDQPLRRRLTTAAHPTVISTRGRRKCAGPGHPQSRKRSADELAAGPPRSGLVRRRTRDHTCDRKGRPAKVIDESVTGRSRISIRRARYPGSRGSFEHSRGLRHWRRDRRRLPVRRWYASAPQSDAFV